MREYRLFKGLSVQVSDSNKDNNWETILEISIDNIKSSDGFLQMIHDANMLHRLIEEMDVNKILGISNE